MLPQFFSHRQIKYTGSINEFIKNISCTALAFLFIFYGTSLLGMRFGIITSKIALVAVLRNFKVKLSSKTKTPLEMDPRNFVPTIKGGLWLNLEMLNK